MKQKLSKIVLERDTLAGRLFDYAVQILILISIASFSIETLPNLSENTLSLINRIELFCVVVFSLEYLLRIYVAPKKSGYILSFWGIIDFVAILPFYLSLGIDLRSIRIFRFLRLFRILKIVRYNRALNRFSIAYKIIKEELFIFFIVIIFIIYLASAGIYFFENEAQPEVFASIFHSLWWAVTTLTTVGYGDSFPITVGGKIFTFVILMIGIGIVAIPAGLISSALQKARKIEEEQQNNLEK